MIPKITNYKYNTVEVPNLDGGINLYDNLTQTNDNQLTDGINVWHRNGLLTTRPAIRHTATFGIFKDNKKTGKSYVDVKNTRLIDGKKYFLVVYKAVDRIRFYYMPEDAEEYDGIHIVDISILGTALENEEFDCNVAVYGNDIYCFCSGYYENEETNYYIYKVTVDNTDGNSFKGSFKRITDDDLYIPFVMVNGKTNGGQDTFDVSENAAFLSKGDFLEGYNLLGSKYKMTYSTVNKELFTDSEENSNVKKAQAATYELLHKAVKNKNISVKLTVHTVDEAGTLQNIKTFTHSVKIEDSDEWNYEKWDSANPSEDGIYIGVKGRTLCLYDGYTGMQKLFTSDDFVDNNNLEITATRENKKENYEKVMNMTFSEWYGGNTQGLYGGIHLFMGGNTKEEEKNLVIYSDVNKPLYFSENCYVYVGNKAQRVTAFGKQDKMLVIFKERELFAADYSSTDTVTSAESVIAGNVTDITVSEVVFPIIQLHGYVGCDCPDTVQLCRNRLVWLHSDGKVYSLVSANQYSERNVYETSKMVESLLINTNIESLRNAKSADWKGYYTLMINNKIILMDYNSYGFVYIASYGKEENAQKKIPWWIWEIPQYTVFDLKNKCEFLKEIQADALVNTSDTLAVFFNSEHIDSYGNIWLFPTMLRFAGNNDKFKSIKKITEGEDIEAEYYFFENLIYSMFKTKLFDFGVPTIKKNVPKIEILLGDNDGRKITVTSVTENGNDEEEVVLSGNNVLSEETVYLQNALIKPRNRINYRFGLKCETKGVMNVSNIVLHYKRFGGLK